MTNAGHPTRTRTHARRHPTIDSHAGAFRHARFDPSRPGLPYHVARDGEQSQTGDIAPGAVDGAVHIIPQSLGLDLFAETIRAPSVVDSLPALPDTTYPIGSLVFLTTDGKLYRNVADAWTVAVDGADIVANSITAGQIAAAAIGTDELAADAVIANVANVGGTVLIDEDGITIADGAISLLDYAGESVLSAGGFGGAWVDFVAAGGYNGLFRAGGVISNQTATSIVNSGFGADYAASLSSLVPYWVVASRTGTARYSLTEGNFGRALVVDKTAAAESTLTIFQDYPATELLSVSNLLSSIFLFVKSETAAADKVEVFLSELDENHELVSGGDDDALWDTISAAADATTDILPKIVADNINVHFDTRFLRIKVKFTLGATAAVHTGKIEMYGFLLRANPTHEGGISLLDRIFFSGSGGSTWDYTNAAFGPEDPTDHQTLVLRTSQYFEDVQVGDTSRIFFRVSAKDWEGLHVGVDAGVAAIRFGGGDAATDASIVRSAAGVLHFDMDRLNHGGALRLSNILAVGMGSDQDDYNPTGLESTGILKITPSANRIITGIQALEDGHLLFLINASTFSITLSHSSGSSAAGNRFSLPGGANHVIGNRSGAILMYDATSGFWRLIAGF